MNAKGRYRLQQGLQAALGRVVEVLVRFSEAGLRPNTKNLILAGGVQELLGSLFPATLADGFPVPSAEEFPQHAVILAARAKHRRKRSTRSRKVRAAKAQLRRDGHPIPEFD